jgi:hypothetical protein
MVGAKCGNQVYDIVAQPKVHRQAISNVRLNQDIKGGEILQ